MLKPGRMATGTVSALWKECVITSIFLCQQTLAFLASFFWNQQTLAFFESICYY